MQTADRVQAGITWLDEHYPGWAEHIDVWKLNMANGDRCVLGQLRQSPLAKDAADEYSGSHGLARMTGFGVMTDMLGWGWDDPTHLGLTEEALIDGLPISTRFAELTRLWVLTIHARQGELAAAGNEA